MSAKEYFQRDAERETFYRTFYQICRRFNVTWSTATPEVRAFIEEVTRVTYEQEKAKRNGVSLSTVKPFFGDMPYICGSILWECHFLCYITMGRPF